MKKYFAFITILLLFCIQYTSAEMVIHGPRIHATSVITDGYDSYVTEVYTWDEEQEQYVIDYVDPAGRNLYVHASLTRFVARGPRASQCKLRQETYKQDNLVARGPRASQC